MQSWLVTFDDQPLQAILESPINPVGCYGITDSDQRRHIIIAGQPLPHAVLGPPVAATPPQPPIPTPSPNTPPPQTFSWVVRFADIYIPALVSAPMDPTGCYGITANGIKHVIVAATQLDPDDSTTYEPATLGPPARPGIG